jgi:hypothetical protein
MADEISMHMQALHDVTAKSSANPLNILLNAFIPATDGLRASNFRGCF